MKLFFVTYENMGGTVRRFPRVPMSVAPGEDDRVKRVCVAPRVSDAFRMFPWKDWSDKAFVYEIEVAQLPKASRDLARKFVPDWKKWTREEIWLLKKEGYVFNKVSHARMFRVPMVTGQKFWGFRDGKSSGGRDIYEMSGPDFQDAVKREAVYKRQVREFAAQFKRGQAPSCSFKSLAVK